MKMTAQGTRMRLFLDCTCCSQAKTGTAVARMHNNELMCAEVQGKWKVERSVIFFGGGLRGFEGRHRETVVELAE